MINKDYLAAAEITKDDDGNIDYKMLCDLHPGFRSEIMNMSDKQIVTRLNVIESYAKSLQHYAFLSWSNEKIKLNNKKK
jgi:hypothetical protein